MIFFKLDFDLSVLACLEESRRSLTTVFKAFRKCILGKNRSAVV
jgi:hypothetical protein